MFFRKRYGHRAIVLETAAGVPGMAAGMLTHLSSLRGLKKGKAKIHEMLAEAENERKHLMFFIEIVNLQSWSGVSSYAQLIFWHYYLVLY